MSTLMADYNTARQAFELLLQPECHKRILLFRGKSGWGKTRLLTYCTDHRLPNISYVPIELRDSAVGVAEIFSRAGLSLQWEYLQKFTRQVAALAGTRNVEIDRNWLMGINNNIQVAMRVKNTTDRESRRVVLTDAWFNDLAEFPKLVVFLFDAYDQALPEVQKWLSGPFLARTAHVPTVRVVVAGESVPDPNNIEWGRCCLAHDLDGVSKAQCWLPIVEAMNRHIPDDVPLSWLNGVCHILGGNPQRIMQVIEGLPLREDHA